MKLCLTMLAGIKGFPGRNVPAAKSYIKWDLTWCVSPTLHHSNTACKSEIFKPSCSHFLILVKLVQLFDWFIVFWGKFKDPPNYHLPE